CLFESLVSKAFGLNEVALRLPSVAAALGSLYLYYRIGVEIADRELGLLLAALYLATPAVTFEVADARPYSIALFLEAAALLSLLRWLRSGRLRHGVFWCLCGSVAIYFHNLF